MGRSRQAVGPLDLVPAGEETVPYRNRDKERASRRRSYRRQRAERLAQGRCTKCGSRPPEPDRTLCAECGAKRRAADRGRYAQARAEGRLQGGAGAEARRRSARAQAKRRYRERRDAGACTKCGRRPPAEGRSRCEPCLSRRNASERRTWAERLAQGRCGACGAPAPDGAARCDPCAALQQGRPSRAAYGRKRYSRRRAQGRCTDCGAHSAGASRCPECARRSYAHSSQHRGLPAAPLSFRVVVVETGEDLGCWQTAAELRACLAFSRLSPEDVEVFSDMPVMNGIASWT